MKVNFLDSFRIQLVAENQLERLFMLEWERWSEIKVEDLMRMKEHHIDPQYIEWEFQLCKAESNT